MTSSCLHSEGQMQKLRKIMTISFMTVIQNIIFALSLNKDTPLSQPSSPQREIRYHKPSFPRGAAAPSLARRGSHNTVTTQPSALRESADLQRSHQSPAAADTRTGETGIEENINIRFWHQEQCWAPGCWWPATWCWPRPRPSCTTTSSPTPS